MKKTNRLILGAASLAPLTGFAQSTNNLPVVDLERVVVTATRTETPVGRTAASVSIITREDMEDRGLNTVAEALETIPGLAIVRNGTPGQATSVFTRGTESNHTLLTVDGRRAPSQLAGGYDWANLPLDNIERIEVVKSSSSALHGGDAIGGVVNIITRTGRGLSKPEYEISFEGGSFNTFQERVAARGAKNGFDYSVTLSQFNADYPRDNNNYRRSSARSSFGYEISDTLYTDIKLSYYQTDGGSPGNTAFAAFNLPAGPDNQRDHLKREVFNVSPGLEWKPDGPLSSKLYYTFENQWQPSFDGFGAFFAGAVNRLNIATHMIDWQADYEVSDDWTVSTGTLWQDQAVDRNLGSATPIEANLQTFGVYAHSQWSLTESFSVINALRFDKYSDYSDEFTWRNGVAYNFDSGTEVFANVARSVAPPTPQDLYFPFAANPALLPEDSVSYELGVRHPFSQDIEASLSFFRHDYDEFIVSNAGTGFIPMNVGNTDINGLEAGLSVRPMDFIRVNANYTYLDTKIERTGLRLIRRPRHQINTSINLKPTEPFTLALGVTYAIGREDGGANTPIGDYALLNARAAYQVQQNTTLWVRGENLLDDKFEYTAGFPALRLGLYGGLKFTF